MLCTCTLSGHHARYSIVHEQTWICTLVETGDVFGLKMILSLRPQAVCMHSSDKRETVDSQTCLLCRGARGGSKCICFAKWRALS